MRWKSRVRGSLRCDTNSGALVWNLGIGFCLTFGFWGLEFTLSCDNVPCRVMTRPCRGEQSAKARAEVAQVVERSPEKAGVGGSTPSLGTTTLFINSHLTFSFFDTPLERGSLLPLSQREASFVRCPSLEHSASAQGPGSSRTLNPSSSFAQLTHFAIVKAAAAATPPTQAVCRAARKGVLTVKRPLM